MSSCRVDKPSEIVDVGDKVWVKLIGKEMKDDKLKLSLSMKVVNQGTGKDLDPNNVSLDQDERKKRTFKDYTSQKITLEAVLNTVCKKCGCKGHFAKECFVQPGGTKYSLIPEEEEEEVAAAGCERDKKTSMGDDSSKKRKKVRGALLLASKSELDNLFCIVTLVIYYSNMVMSNQLWSERVAQVCSGSVAKQESPQQTSVILVLSPFILVKLSLR
uniref:Zinc finger CCHC-type containing 17 n=2 Tax=Athene cunicularia TaxID=194338 RepID=A0A663NCX2_ATHCN